MHYVSLMYMMKVNLTAIDDVQILQTMLFLLDEDNADIDNDDKNNGDDSGDDHFDGLINY